MKAPIKSLFYFSLFIAYACQPRSPQPESFTDRIVLAQPVVNTDSSQVRLEWSKLNHPQFSTYQVLRSDDPQFNPLTRTGAYEVIGYLQSADSIRFVDTKLPYAPQLRYAIVGLLASGSTPSRIASNVVDIPFPQRPYLFSVVNNGPYEILFHPLLERLYLFYRSGLIQAVDLHSRQVSSYANARFNVQVFNDNEFSYYPYIDPITGDVYVPTGASYLRFPAGNLSKPEETNNTTATWSFSSSGNLLFGSDIIVRCLNGSANTSVNGFYGDRAAKIMAFENAVNPYIHLLDITMNKFPTNMVLHYFKPSGEYIYTIQQRGDAPVDHRIVRIAPDGTYLLTSNQGSVFDYALTLKGKLIGGQVKGIYADFAFSADSELIYAANSQAKALDVFDRQLRRQRTIVLQGYPYRLFHHKHQLIVVCGKYPIDTSYRFPDNTVGQGFIQIIPD